MLLCSIYKSPKKEGMYLYVPRKELFAKVPEALMDAFGRPAHVMDMLLQPGKKLANADIDKVMAEVREKGFYLQMPPVSDENLLDRHRRS
ncbi:Conserved hypothetical protein [gamma proteobacterium HdN1]|nr:Conserved hypothetical protein [gamma proteobacterium HdN1]